MRQLQTDPTWAEDGATIEASSVPVGQSVRAAGRLYMRIAMSSLIDTTDGHVPFVVVSDTNPTDQSGAYVEFGEFDALAAAPLAAVRF